MVMQKKNSNDDINLKRLKNAAYKIKRLNYKISQIREIATFMLTTSNKKNSFTREEVQAWSKKILNIIDTTNKKED